MSVLPALGSCRNLDILLYVADKSVDSMDGSCIYACSRLLCRPTGVSLGKHMRSAKRYIIAIAIVSVNYQVILIYRKVYR